ncbi:hypothetical protein [Sphingomonas sp.]|uniref:hypothetical protein n=1 Tax=Sphingomonas sp. TaxID=28214 RepID=UPI003B0085F1
MGRLLLMMAVAASVATGSRLRAQEEPETGTRLHGHTGSVNAIYGQANPASPRETARLMQQFARCIVSSQPGTTEMYLGEPYDPAEGDDGHPSAAFAKLRRTMSFCLGMAGGGGGIFASKAEISGYLFRGMLAEAKLMRLRNPSLPAETEVQKSYEYPWISKDPQQQVVDELGACLAAWRPNDAMALLRTPPESPEERAAMGNLMPLMQACLRKGAVLKSSPAGLRSAISIGLYHRANDAVPVSNASKAN